jgi:hypothetical protein
MTINATDNKILKHERNLFYIQFYVPIILNILFSIILTQEYHLLLIITAALVTCSVANTRVFHDNILKWIFNILSLGSLILTYYYYFKDLVEISIIFLIYVIFIVNKSSLFNQQKFGENNLFNTSQFTIYQIDRVKSNIGILPMLTFSLLLLNLSIWIFSTKTPTTTQDENHKEQSSTIQDLLITILKTFGLIIVAYIIISLIELFEILTDSSYMINEDEDFKYEKYICKKHDKCFCSLGYFCSLEYDKIINYNDNHHHEMVNSDKYIKSIDANGFNISFKGKNGVSLVLACFEVVKCMFVPFAIIALIAIPIVSYLIMDINDIAISIIFMIIFVAIFAFINIIFYNVVFYNLDNSENSEDPTIKQNVQKQYTNSGLSCIHQLIEINHQIIFYVPYLIIQIIFIAILVMIYKNYIKDHIYELQNYINKVFSDNLQQSSQQDEINKLNSYKQLDSWI